MYDFHITILLLSNAAIVGLSSINISQAKDVPKDNTHEKSPSQVQASEHTAKFLTPSQVQYPPLSSTQR